MVVERSRFFLRAGRRFDTCGGYGIVPVAQRIEHRCSKPGVGGSNPSGCIDRLRIHLLMKAKFKSWDLVQFERNMKIPPERVWPLTQSCGAFRLRFGSVPR